MLKTACNGEGVLEGIYKKPLANEKMADMT